MGEIQCPEMEAQAGDANTQQASENRPRRRRRGSAASGGPRADGVGGGLEGQDITSDRARLGALDDTGAGLEPLNDDLGGSLDHEAGNAPQLPTTDEEDDDQNADPDAEATFALIPKKRTEAARKTRRNPAMPLMPDYQHVHMIGELERGEGFPPGVLVRWTITTGDKWELVNGTDGGQSFHDMTAIAADGHRSSIWAHPIDVHFAASELDMKGAWPKLLVQVYAMDQHWCEQLTGYGTCAIPLVAGTHHLEIPTWRPCGNLGDMQETFIFGQPIQVMDDNTILVPSYRRNLSNYEIYTESSGTAHVSLSIIIGTL